MQIKSKLLPYILAIGMLTTEAFSGLPKCYGVSDEAPKMWFMVPNPGASTLPTSTEITLSQTYKAEGSAYRASTKQMYLFDCDGDNTGPCDLHEYTINYTTGTSSYTNVKSNIVTSTGGGSVEGATFYTDAASGEEFLYATVGESGSKLYKWKTSDWSLVTGYPKDLSGDISTITGIAYDPKSKKFYGSKDYSSSSQGTNNSDIFEINMNTGVTTFITEVQHPVDAEGLTYAADGLLYNENDSGRYDGSRTIYAVNLTNGTMIKAATFSGSDDAESLACNAGERSDFGDAPSSYGYAVHSIPVFDITPHPVYLGTNAGDDDTNYKTQATATANGDGADEDGVTLSGASLQGASLVIGQTLTLDITTNGTTSGYLNAWIDFNGDGDFTDAGEQVATNVIPTTGGIALSVTVPSGAKAGETYARFRYSTEQNLPPFDDLSIAQEADDGEVEDYILTLRGSVSGSVKDHLGAPLEAVMISIKDANNAIVNNLNGDPLTTSTDANGNYSFSNVPLGDYFIVESDKSGYISVSDVDSSDDGDTVNNSDTNDNSIPFTLTTGETDANNDFIDKLESGSASGFVKDSSGYAIAGVTLSIMSGTAVIDDIYGNPLTTTTDLNGSYTFNDIPLGDYMIVENDLSGYTSISDGDSSDDSDNTTNTDTNDNAIPLTITSGENDSDNIFIDQGGKSIHGKVLVDIDGDEIEDKGLANVTVKLSSCQTSTFESTTTDTDGHFHFDNLIAGCYKLTEIDPEGYGSVKDSDAINDNNVTIAVSDDNITNIYFLDEPSLTISGNVKADIDFDGTVDKALTNVPIALFAFDGALLETIQTDANGHYRFTQVTPGTYTIKETDPKGYASLRDIDGDDKNTIMITVTESDITGQNFEDQKRVTVSGVVKVDIDGDNQVDEPLKNATLIICKVVDPCTATNHITSVNTDENGSYTFEDLTPGAYQIVELDKDGYESIGDADGANDNTIHINLDGLGDITNQDFDNQAVAPKFILITKTTSKKQASIGDFVPYTITLENVNNSYNYAALSLKDILPAGFNYVKDSARLLRGRGETKLIPSGTRTLSFGPLLLQAHEKITLSYLLKVGVSVAKGAHTNRAVAIQNDTEVSNFATATVTITADPFIDNALVIGKVFDDQNENGIQDSGERGIPGVRLATVTGMLIQTDGYGRYHIADANSGGFGGRGKNYIVKVDKTTLPEGATLTTENPRVLRITSSGLNVIDFGVKLPKIERFSKERKITKVRLKKERISVEKDISLGSIYFDSDQDCIRPDQVKTLCKIAKKIKQYQNGSIMIEGNTDARAPMWYNKKLAYKRAQSVYKELRHQLGDKLIKNVDVIYDNCQKEVIFNPRYDWWGKPNVPHSKKECTQFGITQKECHRLLQQPKGGAL